jgi:hypothetical protein
MALPTVMQLGTRIIFWPPFQPPVLPTGAPVIAPPSDGRILPIPGNIVGSPPPYAGMQGTGPFIGMCCQPGGSTPDWLGSAAIIFDGRGAPFLVALGINLSTWQSAGSVAGVGHWSFVDLTA